jgi:hypothetical protein
VPADLPARLCCLASISRAWVPHRMFGQPALTAGTSRRDMPTTPTFQSPSDRNLLLGRWRFTNVDALHTPRTICWQAPTTRTRRGRTSSGPGRRTAAGPWGTAAPSGPARPARGPWRPWCSATLPPRPTGARGQPGSTHTRLVRCTALSLHSSFVILVLCHAPTHPFPRAMLPFSPSSMAWLGRSTLLRRRFAGHTSDSNAIVVPFTRR